MSMFRKFAIGQRKIELTEPFLIINENITPKLYEYLQELDNIAFRDGEYFKYCGQIKTVLNCFINYWSEVINECVKEADLMRHQPTRDELLDILHSTVVVQHHKQETFTNSFLPTQNDEEQEQFNEIEELFKMRLKDYEDMREHILTIDTPKWTCDFMNHNIALSIKKKNEAFAFTNTYIAKELASTRQKLKISFEECLLRARTNLRLLKEESYKKLRRLMHDLHDQNKEKLRLLRLANHQHKPLAEVDLSIARIRNRIKNFDFNLSVYWLEEEVVYWKSRVYEFLEINKTLEKLNSELSNVIQQQKHYQSIRTIEIPGFRRTCFETIKENLKNRKEYIEEALQEASHALMTFFAVRGRDRILYKDEVGKYFVDEYSHQVYYLEHGKVVYHITCDGIYKQVPEGDKYYYDGCGRYTIDEKGEKVYQCAPCTSTYKLGEDELLVKTTKDCGHSEFRRPHCHMHRRPRDTLELLPDADPDFDIKGTMLPEVTKYLWDNLGYNLSYALHDTGKKRSKNPIYYLAHRILNHKYFTKEIDGKQKEARLYRNNLINKKKQKATSATQTWKAKQGKPCKPEECDDPLCRELFERKQFLSQQNYYDE